MHFRLFFADGGDVYCCCTNSIFTPLGRWLAFQRGPLLFMAMGCNRGRGCVLGLRRSGRRKPRTSAVRCVPRIRTLVSDERCLRGESLCWSFGTAALQLHSIKRALAVHRCFSRCFGTLQTNTCAL